MNPHRISQLTQVEEPKALDKLIFSRLSADTTILLSGTYLSHTQDLTGSLILLSTVRDIRLQVHTFAEKTAKE